MASRTSRRETMRRVGLGLIALAAVLVTGLAAPAAPEAVDTSRFDDQITMALEDYEANNQRTEGAPQQAVVNGWIARDLLTVIAKQTNALLGSSQASAGDPRIPLLLMLLVLAATLYGMTASSGVVPARPSSGSGFTSAAEHTGASTSGG